MIFCLTVVCRAVLFNFFYTSPINPFYQLDAIHHHHTLEETFYFPTMEEKLGQGSLSGNVEQHKEFIPGLEALEQWCKKVQEGEAQYDGEVFMRLVEAFADTMVAHLSSVRCIFTFFHCSSLYRFNCTDLELCQEITDLDREVLKTHFTLDELKAIDSELTKRALVDIDLYKALPLVAVCANPSTPW